MSDDDEVPAAGLRSVLRRFNRPSPTLGTVDVALDPQAVRLGLADLGEAGKMAGSLDARVTKMLKEFSSLSELTAQLALTYLERIRHPLVSLTLEGAVTLTTRGYLAHMAVEADPTRFGSAVEIPVLDSFPDLRRGRPPQDLLTRVVKATRKGFAQIRAVPDDVWTGYVLCATGHAHAGAGGDGPALLEQGIVDSLLRFGWVLRQVDLRYGLSPGSPGSS